MRVCSAHRQDGAPCRLPAINGGTVCNVHGGRAPQVVRAAKLRLALATDVAAAGLVRIITSKRSKDSDVIAACKDILDRAGIRAEREPVSGPASDGTVLYEEFIEIHRRKVLELKDGAPTE